MTSMRALCAEFPNDNPDLHLGAIWVLREPASGPTAETREIELGDAVLSALSDPPSAAGDQDAPTQTPPDDQASVIVAQAAASKEQPFIINDDPATAITDPPTAINDPAPAINDPAPAINDPTPAINDPAPAINDLATAIDDPAPAINDLATAINDPPTAIDGQPAAESVAESESELAAVPEPAPLESMIVLSVPDAARGDDESIVVEELDFDLSGVPLEGATVEEDGYATLVQTLAAVAMAEGATAEAVHGILEGEDARTAAAWRAVLRGEVDDISTCGSAMLDEWAADVVARAIGAPGRAAQLQRELRARGVCAFGLIAA